MAEPSPSLEPIIEAAPYRSLVEGVSDRIFDPVQKDVAPPIARPPATAIQNPSLPKATVTDVEASATCDFTSHEAEAATPAAHGEQTAADHIFHDLNDYDHGAGAAEMRAHAAESSDQTDPHSWHDTPTE